MIRLLTYYVLQPDVATTVNLYQPYVPTAQDYKQNFGSLDGHSIRQVSDSEAALHVAGWHASGSVGCDNAEWLIVFDNTFDHEISGFKSNRLTGRTSKQPTRTFTAAFNPDSTRIS